MARYKVYFKISTIQKTAVDDITLLTWHGQW